MKSRLPVRWCAIVVALLLAFCAGCDKDPVTSEQSTFGPVGRFSIPIQRNPWPPVNCPEEAVVTHRVSVAPDSGAVLTVHEPVFDFGHTIEGRRVVHTFWLHSSGTDTVRIDSLHAH